MSVLNGLVGSQYINPIVKNSQHPLKGNLLYAIERVLKLSVPNLYVWLCMFYCLFHLWYVFFLKVDLQSLSFILQLTVHHICSICFKLYHDKCDTVHTSSCARLFIYLLVNFFIFNSMRQLLLMADIIDSC